MCGLSWGYCFHWGSLGNLLFSEGFCSRTSYAPDTGFGVLIPLLLTGIKSNLSIVFPE